MYARLLHLARNRNMRQNYPDPYDIPNLDPNGRVPVVAVMMCLYPENCMHNYEEGMEARLREVAKDLLEYFENLVNELWKVGGYFSKIDFTLYKEFPAKFHKYLRMFQQWKARDLKRTAANIKGALHDLYEQRARIPADEPADSRLNQNYKKTISQLECKLQEYVPKSEYDSFIENESRAIMIAPIEAKKLDRAAILRLEFPKSPEQMAHELLIDRNFQLDERRVAIEDLPQTARSHFNQDFWEYMCMDIVSKGWNRARDITATILQGVQDVAIEKKVPFLLKDICAETLADWRGFLSELFNVMENMQDASSRGNEINQAWPLIHKEMEKSTTEFAGVVVRALKLLFEFSNLLRIQTANQKLRSILHVIQKDGAVCERDKFNEKLALGCLTIDKTKVNMHLVIYKQNTYDSKQGWIRDTLLLCGNWSSLSEVILPKKCARFDIVWLIWLAQNLVV